MTNNEMANNEMTNNEMTNESKIDVSTEKSLSEQFKHQAAERPDYTRTDILYRNPWDSWMCKQNKPDIIWRKKNIDEEIERFKKTYERWCNNYPLRIRRTTGKHPRELTADDYIKMFLACIEDIQNEAEQLNWPWEWCIDDLSFNAKYFNPKRIILGDSRLFYLTKNGPGLVSISQENKKGKNCKRSTRLNNHYRTYCDYDEKTYGKTNRKATLVNVEEFVCNYFRQKPNVKNVTLEAGHLFGFNPNFSSIVNNNMHNVRWQTSNDNRSIQRLFDNHNYESVFEKEAEKRGLNVKDVEYEEIRWMLEDDPKAVEKYDLEMAYDFTRDENGQICKITLVQNRLIVPAKA